MNKGDKSAILNLAKMFLREYTKLRNPEDPWENLGAYQANYDALRGFQHYGFIQDFDVDKGILIDEVWYQVGACK